MATNTLLRSPRSLPSPTSSPVSPVPVSPASLAHPTGCQVCGCAHVEIDYFDSDYFDSDYFDIDYFDIDYLDSDYLDSLDSDYLDLDSNILDSNSEVERQAASLELGECPRCEHRWTRPTCRPSSFGARPARRTRRRGDQPVPNAA